MDRFPKMSETESKIIEVLWNSKEPMLASELIDFFVHHGKVWKAPTLSTFLSRLSQKGLVDSTRGCPTIPQSKDGRRICRALPKRCWTPCIKD